MAITQEQNLIWAAGVIEGCGVLACAIEQGPIKVYHSLTLLVPVGHSESIRRLTIAADNGSVSKSPVGFELSGVAAVRGFLRELWPYLTPHKKSEFNAELKR